MFILETILIGTVIFAAFTGGVQLEKFRHRQIKHECWYDGHRKISTIVDRYVSDGDRTTDLLSHRELNSPYEL